MKGKITCGCMIVFGFIPSLLSAEVYKWTDKNGNVHFSDKKSTSTARPVQFNSSINSYSNSAVPAANVTSSSGKLRQKGKTKLPGLAPRQVIIYTTTWCTFCKKAKSYFRQKGIVYSERNIESSLKAKKEYHSYGGGGVPLILVGNKKGTRKLSGFSIARFNALYN